MGMCKMKSEMLLGPAKNKPAASAAFAEARGAREAEAASAPASATDAENLLFFSLKSQELGQQQRSHLSSPSTNGTLLTAFITAARG